MTDVRVRVLDGWAVHDGTTQRSGDEQLEVDREIAAKWIAAGWVEPVKAPRKRP